MIIIINDNYSVSRIELFAGVFCRSAAEVSLGWWGVKVVSVGCGDYLGYAFVMLIAGGELALALSGVLFIAKYRAF